MKRGLLAVFLMMAFSLSLYGQSGSINNTLGTGGLFSIKDGSATFMSLSQSDGYLGLNKSLLLPATTGSTLGVIYKGADRFIHDYKPPGVYGYNTFVGVNSGNFTMAGAFSEASGNTAVGHSSLSSLTTGYSNCGFGYRPLLNNTTGYNNSAFGYESLFSTTTGSGNSGFGYYTLRHTTGNNNTAIGYGAGYNPVIGSNNTFIGYGAERSADTVSNEITLGNAGITTLRCNTQVITSLSDARDKKNIEVLPLGLDFLMKVKPRLFYWDRREWYEDGKADGSKMQTNPTAGFIAQELDDAQTKADAEWLNLVLKSNSERLEATPGNLLPIMVKAIQELKNENDALKGKLARLDLVQQQLMGEMERLKSGNRTAFFSNRKD